MTTALAHSIFHDIIFPAAEASASHAEAPALLLRRALRFVPPPALDIRSAPLIVFDFETTGLDPETDRIIEIGAQKVVGGKVLDEFSTLVSTDVELTAEITKLTGITQQMLVGQPSIEDALPRFLEFMEGGVLVAHNAEFDMGMLRAATARQNIDLEWACFCTLKMARQLLTTLENRKLDTLALHYGLSFEARHRSVGDVKVLVGVLYGMLAKEAAALSRWQDFRDFSVTA